MISCNKIHSKLTAEQNANHFWNSFTIVKAHLVQFRKHFQLFCSKKDRWKPVNIFPHIVIQKIKISRLQTQICTINDDWQIQKKTHNVNKKSSASYYKLQYYLAQYLISFSINLSMKQSFSSLTL